MANSLFGNKEPKVKLADKIKYSLMRAIRSSAYDVIIPNWYDGIFEMDVFRLTQSGVIYEYEIKISKSEL